MRTHNIDKDTLARNKNLFRSIFKYLLSECLQFQIQSKPRWFVITLMSLFKQNSMPARN